MASEAQIAANQHNAQHSTGPKTPEGKKRSYRNSFKHGLCAEDVCGPGESSEDLRGVTHDLIEEYRPATRTEAILVERMALAYHHSKRALRLELDTYERCQRNFGTAPDDSLRLLHRYHKDHDRGFIIALEEVRRAQSLRRAAILAGDIPAQSLEFEEIDAPDYSPSPEIGFVSETLLSPEPEQPVTKIETEFTAQNQQLSENRPEIPDSDPHHERRTDDRPNSTTHHPEGFHHLEQPPGLPDRRSDHLPDERGKRLQNLSAKTSRRVGKKRSLAR